MQKLLNNISINRDAGGSIPMIDPLDETNKNISWSFNLNLSAYYLPEYGENVKKERELMENIFSQ